MIAPSARHRSATRSSAAVVLPQQVRSADLHLSTVHGGGHPDRG